MAKATLEHIIAHADIVGTLEALRILSQFVDSVIWPATIVILFVLLKQPISRLVDGLATRIRDPNSSISISKDGLSVTALERGSRNIEETQRTVIEFLRQRLGNEASDQERAWAELEDKAKAYDKILETKNLNKRLAELEELANELGALVIANGIDRDDLVHAAENGTAGGFVLALVSAVATSPIQGDTERILSIGSQVKRPALLFRATLALRRLAEHELVASQEFPGVLRLLVKYELRRKRPDSDTQANIDAVRRLLSV